jgi:ADP-heptose:LPS heptosyltransferase
LPSKTGQPFALKDFLKLTLYQLVYYAVRCFSAPAVANRLLLVKTDEIGDYVLLRNLLPLFRTEGPYRDHHIIFVGNSVFRQIYEQYDSGVADEVIWLDKKRFARDPFYRFRFLLTIRRTRASVAISLVHSRILRKDDVIMAVSPAPIRIAMCHESRLASSYERWLTPKRTYTRLEDGGPDTLFDAIRNARFVERLLGLPPQPISTAIPVRADVGAFGLPHRYFVIFPGSGVPVKKWPAANFAAVARHLAGTYDLIPVVCGSAADAADTAEFIRLYRGPVVDLTARTSLPQLLSVLYGARCLVSVDTGSVHLAAAVGCPVFALYSGSHYGRFAPYPATIASAFYPIYPDEVDALIRDGTPVDFELIPLEKLRAIPPEKMIARIDAIFPTITKKSSAREGTA